MPQYLLIWSLCSFLRPADSSSPENAPYSHKPRGMLAPINWLASSNSLTRFWYSSSRYTVFLNWQPLTSSESIGHGIGSTGKPWSRLPHPLSLMNLSCSASGSIKMADRLPLAKVFRLLVSSDATSPRHLTRACKRHAGVCASQSSFSSTNKSRFGTQGK